MDSKSRIDFCLSFEMSWRAKRSERDGILMSLISVGCQKEMSLPFKNVMISRNARNLIYLLARALVFKYTQHPVLRWSAYFVLFFFIPLNLKALKSKSFDP